MTKKYPAQVELGRGKKEISIKLIRLASNKPSYAFLIGGGFHLTVSAPFNLCMRLYSPQSKPFGVPICVLVLARILVLDIREG